MEEQEGDGRKFEAFGVERVVNCSEMKAERFAKVRDGAQYVAPIIFP